MLRATTRIFAARSCSAPNKSQAAKARIGSAKFVGFVGFIGCVRFVGCLGFVGLLSTQGAFAATPAKGTGKANTLSNQKAKSTSAATKSSPTKPGTAKVPAGKGLAAPAKLKSLSARVPVIGWDAIGAAAWPLAGDSVIARANGDSVDVFRNPADPNTSLRLIKGRSVAGPVVLMAVGAAGDFVRVAIPLRPNGTLGWVRRSDVTLVRSAFRVEIDLSTNSMTVFEGDKALFRVPVATGTGGTPTPLGLFFFKELVPQSPGGALGPFAMGLSGFSNVLFSFAGGEGVIAIHGTNAPGKLGTKASHGCVRVDNVSITKMARLLPLGTPVEIIESAKPKKPTRSSSAWLDTLLSGAVGSDAAPVAASLSSFSEATLAVLLVEPTGSPAVSAVAGSPTATAAPTSTVPVPTTTEPSKDDLLGAVAIR